MISNIINTARNFLSKAPATPPVLTNAPAFFTAVRGITKGLDQTQVDTLNALAEKASANKWPIGWLAYGLATAWHEARFVPQDEWGKGRGRRYGVKGKYGQIPYGRGLVQLTWDFNYEWADKALGLGGALLKNFDLANRPDIASEILVKGMQSGAFTGKTLSNYLGTGLGSVSGFTNARRIINGTDKAAEIARYAVQFQNALVAGGYKAAAQ